MIRAVAKEKGLVIKNLKFNKQKTASYEAAISKGKHGHGVETPVQSRRRFNYDREEGKAQ